MEYITRRFLFLGGIFVKFIHAADLHLGSPFKGLRNSLIPDDLWKQIYHSTFAAFTKLVDDSIALQVPFILLSGDIFDGHVINPQTNDFFHQQMIRLQSHHIEVFMLYGNHDYHSVTSIHQDWPANVHVFPNQITTKFLEVSGQKVAITGFSYNQRWIQQDVVLDYPSRLAEADIQIGMLHGAVKQGHNDNYAPFTLDELISKNYDYWALGHIHKQQQLNQQPPIYYAGNTQGRHKNESGTKGYLLVDTNDNRKAKLVPTSVINWQNVNYSLSWTTIENVKITLLDFIQQQKYTKMQLINLTLKLNTPIDDEQVTTLLSRLQSDLIRQYRTLNVWIYQININVVNNDFIPQFDQSIWQEAQTKIFTPNHINHTIKSLAKYDFLARHFDHNTDQLIKDAKTKLLLGKEDVDEN
jgi:DNA repair protein SbcD/Mre11